MTQRASIAVQLQQVYAEDANKILATLLAVFGAQHVRMLEDSVQDAFTKALTRWPDEGVPQNPTGWLQTVARRQAIDRFRRLDREVDWDSAPELESGWSQRQAIESQFKQADDQDQELSLLFWVAGADIPESGKLPVMLNLLCNLTIDEVSSVLRLQRETVKKRLLRAKQKLSEQRFEYPTAEASIAVVDHVNLALYLLFNTAIRHGRNADQAQLDVCIRVIGTIRVLLSDAELVNSESFALGALIHFHFGRLPARVERERLQVPLDAQDRTLWDKAMLGQGMVLLDKALDMPNQSKRFLLEALIAYEHCRAPSFSKTDWRCIVTHYKALCALTDSPLFAISLAVAMAYGGEVKDARETLAAIETDTLSANQKDWYAASAVVESLNGCRDSAMKWFTQYEATESCPELRARLKTQLDKNLSLKRA